MPVTGQFAIDFSVLADTPSYANANLTNIGPGVPKILSGALMWGSGAATQVVPRYNGSMNSSGILKSRIEFGAANTGGDWNGAALVDASGNGYGIVTSSATIYIMQLTANAWVANLASTTQAVVAHDVLELDFNLATHDLTGLFNATPILSANDATTTSGLAFAPWLDANNVGACSILSFAGDGIPAIGGVAIGGEVGRRRPVGRGPQMDRVPAAFKRSQGSQATRQVLLQLFSSPGVPLANASVTFFTAYNDAGAAIDGPMIRTTDASGYVLLVGLNIAAVAGNIRYQITGDPTKHRVSAVNFVN